MRVEAIQAARFMLRKMSDEQLERAMAGNAAGLTSLSGKERLDAEMRQQLYQEELEARTQPCE